MTALVPVKKGSIVVYEEKMFDDVIYATREEVKKHLPDICGKMLAKSWHDEEFAERLASDINKTFRDNGIILPDIFRLEYEKTSGQRAKISIYEQVEKTKFKLRVCSLTLTMMAMR